MFKFVKKLNSLQSRVMAWILIVVIPILGLTSIWVYLFLNYFYSHYMITPLVADAVPQSISSTQPLVHETLIAWGILLGIISIYIGIINVIAQKRMQQLLLRFKHNTITPNDTQASNNLDFPAEVYQVINAIADLNKETEQKLNQYQQINADMTHELRSPLHTSGLTIESMREEIIAPTPQTFAILYNEVQRIHRLVEDMRTLSLLDINRFPLYRQPTNLHEILVHVATAKSIPAQHNNVCITVCESRNITVHIDFDRIIQAISNILDNAIRHSPAGSTIAVHYTIHKSTVHLSISDAGTGIDPAEIPHLFTRFYRGKNAKGQGSGLGLAIAHAIITAHGGTITIDSIINQGTTITILLPCECPTIRNFTQNTTQ